MTTATPVMPRSPDHLVEEPDVTADAGLVARSASDVARDAAFEREALPWLDDVYRFALSLTREESDADDVVQETFLRAYRSWHTFIPGTDCRRWLFTICRNVFLRSRERQKTLRQIVKSNRRQSVPGMNVCHDRYARRKVSCTTSSASD